MTRNESDGSKPDYKIVKRIYPKTNTKSILEFVFGKVWQNIKQNSILF